MRLLALVSVTTALAVRTPPAAAQMSAEEFGDIYLTMHLTLDPFGWFSRATCIDDPGLAPFSPLDFFLAIDGLAAASIVVRLNITRAKHARRFTRRLSLLERSC